MEDDFKMSSIKEKALLYHTEKDRADRLHKEVEDLSRQLRYRNNAPNRKTVYKFSSHLVANEDMLSKLPVCSTLQPSRVEVYSFELGAGTFGSVTIGKLLGLELEVAVKKSKGFSLLTEGRICQSLSGHPNFPWFFEMLGNDIVMELIRIFDIVKVNITEVVLFNMLCLLN